MDGQGIALFGGVSCAHWFEYLVGPVQEIPAFLSTSLRHETPVGKQSGGRKLLQAVRPPFIIVARTVMMYIFIENYKGIESCDFGVWRFWHT